MEKVILLPAIILIVVVIWGYGVYRSVYNVPQPPDVTLSNVEALARNENGDLFPDCEVKQLEHSDDYVLYSNLKKRFLSSNCKVKCGYTCRVRMRLRYSVGDYW